MSHFFEIFRKTASRVYKRKGDDDGELHPLQDVCDKYSSSCFNLYQVSDMNLFRINFTRGCDKFTINFRATKRFNQQHAQREKNMFKLFGSNVVRDVPRSFQRYVFMKT